MNQQTLSIGQAAELTGISRKMIRYYEDIGLLPAAQRTQAGYRYYHPEQLEQLRFIKRAKDMGFSLERISQLMQLWHDEHRHSADVKQLALQYIQEIEDSISKMQVLRDQLRDWVDHCHGDERPDCSIINKLASDSCQDHS